MKYLTILFLLVSTTCLAQHDGIEIDVVKGHKKITYTAQNTTSDTLDLFFKVISDGFRRSADRPIITTVPAKSTINLLTLIPKKNADTTHTYIAVVTKPEHNIQIRKTDTVVREIRKVDPVKKSGN
ncbi:hypothetical protein [Nonlabens ponticola]|uniref:Uncharacterized protein n=1 Tax=Nonlabens ponticola TaxID=2496866 RepID=A0A3S9N0S3_9FLAO|nr:hypothetical protein [Nonlabens ponticola]AZQ44913.1 hypothetical protein EJ995_12010 [Nonlabens ponticola]